MPIQRIYCADQTNMALAFENAGKPPADRSGGINGQAERIGNATGADVQVEVTKSGRRVIVATGPKGERLYLRKVN